MAAQGRDVYGNSREKQACIWRARRHDRYLEFFGLGLGRLMLPSGSAYTLQKIYTGNKMEEITVDDLEESGIDYDFYNGPSDIAQKLEPGKILCILFPGTSLEETRFYSDLFVALVNRRSQDFVHLAIDEAGDIIPPYNTDSYKVQKQFVDATGDFRKTLINSIFASHAYTDLDYRILPKLPYHIYKRGAQKIHSDTRKLKQDTINDTKVNESWWTNGAFFDKLIFPAMETEARLDFRLQTVARTMTVETE